MNEKRRQQDRTADSGAPRIHENIQRDFGIVEGYEQQTMRGQMADDERQQDERATEPEIAPPNVKVPIHGALAHCAQGIWAYRNDDRRTSEFIPAAATIPGGMDIGAPPAASSRIRSAPFSPIITAAALVLPETRVGMIDASTTRRRSKPRTRRRSSTTAVASEPMRQVAG